ncbi:MAG TPA: acyltransferase [Afipia sp.]|uniref:acyltransferase family protein n=1 Tax=unclassified Afipia TaxID=2642050 RepID=UPI0004663AD5|nr:MULTISPECIES: acyltransferase [unclassified Afipia]MAH72360.1 acyltransferase [Afipia sp.]OUX58455.1 MAG: acyltransferase [Afipia sp. TMED4]HAP12395.1 acyltransferase [Afipia sp.]HAP48397.1 acyltransferase [Afipia sp.]HBF53851.1 acyltransferase [Afipia sp.]
MVSQRLRAVDGLRGVAILLVMGFHYFYHLESFYYKSTLYPYGETFSNVLIFKYGYMGVELFFIISGFVIAMTLESSRSVIDFVIRRFVRIWPALIVSAILTFFLLNWSDAPFALHRRQSWPNFLPSLTLTPPSLWSGWFPKVDYITGVYWSLVVEIRFYMIAAILFWLFSREKLARNLVIFTLVVYIARALLRRAMPGYNGVYDALFIPDYLPWFAAGAVFYELYKERLAKGAALIMLAMIYALIARVSTNYAMIGRDPVFASAAALAFMVLFWFLATKPASMRLFEVRPLVWIGECSYSIYLYHYAVGMILISQVSKTIGLAPQLLLVAAISLLVLAVGRVSYAVVENPARRWLTKLLIGPPQKPAAAASPAE